MALVVGGTKYGESRVLHLFSFLDCLRDVATSKRLLNEGTKYL